MFRGYRSDEIDTLTEIVGKTGASGKDGINGINGLPGKDFDEARIVALETRVTKLETLVPTGRGSLSTGPSP